MAGNSSRRGAVRNSGSKKGPQTGSGGQRRRGLEGKGPTPKAAERPNHKAYDKSAGNKRPTNRATTGRKKASTEMIAGRNSVVEALRTEVPITTMFIANRIDSDDRVRESLTIAAEAGIPIMETPRSELDRLTDGAVHQGLAAQVPAYQYAHPADLMDSEIPGVPLIVALDGITDPRNLGAIVRSVGAFGGHGVVVPQRRSAGMTASAWKTSAGAAARIPVAQAANLVRALEDYRKAGFFVIGLDMEGDVELPGLDLATSALVVVIGSEGKGLSRLVRETCDQIVSIPMSSATESLNAGIAAGVTLYEIARLRGAQR
ncbi:RNA methyltransferase [Janibacter sp. Soil728]|uniref:23S rRNA (guanosine(2251)-2'-O)-methyltransferase RlmB n=1 Tax=Janibacter sp. Soil728 TaxID=1736393 RepID=UPI0006FA8ED5|nr:23S rRNA (guanosine(2251)-2'-O)-methyltransferase RlmB [Janibacter sp. Soil728]KRE36085.1 RNA methyltransferase [Janibacter sp. Soil728]